MKAEAKRRKRKAGKSLSALRSWWKWRPAYLRKQPTKGSRDD